VPGCVCGGGPIPAGIHISIMVIAPFVCSLEAFTS
jgi:hypothetical protein